MKKVVIVLLVIIHVLFLLQNIANAVTIGENPYLYHKFVCDYHLQYWKEDHWSYAYVDYVVYKDEQGKEYPAYCLNETLHGVGTWEGSQEGYHVDITELIQDDRIWRVAIHGYPYQTPAQMGVENEQDAFVATKYAIYSIISGYQVREKYHGDTPRGQKIVNAIEKLVDIGRNGTQKRVNAKLTIKELEDFKIDTINPEYYSKEYQMTSNVPMNQYEIQNIEGFPEGSKIVNLKSEEQITFQSKENFKILIPKEKMEKDFQSSITVKGVCQTYPVFYGKTTYEGYQNYAITADTYADIVTTQTFNTHLYGYFTCNKIASDNNLWTGHIQGQGVSGATYEIRNEKNELIKTVVSDEEGKITTKCELPIGIYTIRETETPEYFILDSTIYEFEITYQDVSTLEIQEQVVKCGYLNFIKMSSDDNLWTNTPANSFLAGAVYELQDKEGKLISQIETNEKGGLDKPIKLKEGTYTLKEIKAPEHYVIDETTYEFEIVDNGQHISYTFYNKSVPKEIKKLPKTGM